MVPRSSQSGKTIPRPPTRRSAANSLTSKYLGMEGRQTWALFVSTGPWHLVCKSVKQPRSDGRSGRPTAAPKTPHTTAGGELSLPTRPYCARILARDSTLAEGKRAENQPDRRLSGPAVFRTPYTPTARRMDSRCHSPLRCEVAHCPGAASSRWAASVKSGPRESCSAHVHSASCAPSVASRPVEGRLRSLQDRGRLCAIDPMWRLRQSRLACARGGH
jgi:hypothetical protein